MPTKVSDRSSWFVENDMCVMCVWCRKEIPHEIIFAKDKYLITCLRCGTIEIIPVKVMMDFLANKFVEQVQEIGEKLEASERDAIMRAVAGNHDIHLSEADQLDLTVMQNASKLTLKGGLQGPFNWDDEQLEKIGINEKVRTGEFFRTRPSANVWEAEIIGPGEVCYWKYASEENSVHVAIEPSSGRKITIPMIIRCDDDIDRRIFGAWICRIVATTVAATLKTLG